MAKRQSTTKSTKRRSHRPHSAAKVEAGSESLFNALEEAIEEERSRLGRADMVLECLCLALMYAEEDPTARTPDFSDVARVAQELVNKAINNLDSVQIGPLIDRVTGTGKGKG